MIDRTAIRRLTLVSALLFGVVAAFTAAVWRSPALTGGVAVGFVMGLAPFLSWAWLAQGGFESVRRRILALVLVAGKLAFYSGVLYLTVTRELVTPAGVLAGLTVTVFSFAVGSLMVNNRGPAKEACL